MGVSPSSVEKIYIPSLGGIRAVSVLLVILSHVGYAHIVPGGLGVTIFFFLSGYLITTLILNEHSRNGTISISNFYIRRFFRLAPPLIITLTIAYALTLNNILPGTAKLEGFIAQLFYFANYYSLFFQGGANVPSGTGILWSLAVEEHFYIFYPLLITAMISRLQLRSIAAVLFGICFLVLAWRYYLIFESAVIIPDRTYYATDTRIDSILYGCIFAILCNPIKNNIPCSISHGKGWMLLFIGGSLLVFTLLYRDAFFRESFRYSLQGIALMPIFYGVITMSDSYIFKFLNWRVMRKLGVYSYVIYLSHFMIINVLQNTTTVVISPVVLFASALTLSTIFAAVLDMTVESRFRRLRKQYHT